ncbi:MAG: hypothetical protein A4E73_00397 [Syntrophaceae bacterium PtaU1.Bin231]|nr:MAG: hypothetical protein A4E73_00397 [Syntrophaceae bacterium PtaU1.Bin231]
MKKLFAIIIAILFLAGCAGIQFGSDDASQAVLYKLAGHRLGYEMGKKDPATAQIALKAVDGIIQTIETGTTAEALSVLLQEGLAKLSAGYANDPALAAEVAIVAELVIFKGSQVDTTAYKQYLAQMKAGMEGFKLGYALALAVAAK